MYVQESLVNSSLYNSNTRLIRTNIFGLDFPTNVFLWKQLNSWGLNNSNWFWQHPKLNEILQIVLIKPFNKEQINLMWYWVEHIPKKVLPIWTKPYDKSFHGPITSDSVKYRYIFFMKLQQIWNEITNWPCAANAWLVL